MSYTFTLTGRSSVLTANINPPIYLEDGEWVISLINFESYNTIPNIEEGINNSFYFNEKKFVLPTGSYDIKDIKSYLNRFKQPGEELILKANRSTLKCEILTNRSVDFTKNDTFRGLLGFKSRKLEAYVLHIADYPTDILKVNAINISCNLVVGSFRNSQPTHILHTFFPNAEPGEKIIESPQNPIYMPISTHRISSIIVQIHDQDNSLINFREEVITIRLHLRKLPHNGN